MGSRLLFLHRVIFPALLLGWAALTPVRAQTDPISWTVLTPEHDSRPADVREYDEFDSRSLIRTMNAASDAFHHRLTWQKVAIKDLPSTPTPFCELRFDAVHPLILTDAEKGILRDYMMRGGFVLLYEDAYPYTQDEFWSVKEWPVVDFLKKELPASSPDFKAQKITDAHPLFHQYYETQTAEMVKHELQDNPYTPNRTLLMYQDRPCAFVFGRYNLVIDGKWAAMPRPFEEVFSLESRGYELAVNIYVYATMH